MMCRTMKPKQHRSRCLSCGGVQTQAPSFSYGVSDVFYHTFDTKEPACPLGISPQRIGGFLVGFSHEPLTPS
ncbi:MAG TPA: hypothetical protein VN207_04490 [Ktedonobacteraceae bacterium]|nr:hypothetical protein [Ktedonobacteraceae bacterium]